MSTTRVLTARPLDARPAGRRAPIWWAMMLLVLIETIVFGTLLSSYFYLLAGSAAWPTDDLPLPGLLLPAMNTVVLLTSSIAVLWGGLGIRNGDQRQLKVGLGAGVLLEAVFLSVKIIEARSIPFSWGENAYASIFWSISGLHSVHVVVAILMAGAAEFLALRGYYTRERRIGIQVVSIYWQFVALIWVPVAVVLYLVPRWL